MADDTRNDQSVIADDIRESIAISGFTAAAGQPSGLSNLAYSNAIANNNSSQQNIVSNQQAMNQLAQATLGSTARLVIDQSPLEAVTIVKMDTGNDVAQQLADLQAAINSGPDGGGGPFPPPVPPPLPTVTNNPAGGSIVKASVGNFPTTLHLDEEASTPGVKRVKKGGTIIVVNSNAFPVEFHLRGGSQDLQHGTVIEVSKDKFPIQIHTSTGASGPSVADTRGGPTLFKVNEVKFPVQINLAAS